MTRVSITGAQARASQALAGMGQAAGLGMEAERLVPQVAERLATMADGHNRERRRPLATVEATDRSPTAITATQVMGDCAPLVAKMRR